MPKGNRSRSRDAASGAGETKDSTSLANSPPTTVRVGAHLLNLPLDLYRELLQYLTLWEIGDLDLALLNHQFREIYWASLSGTVIPEIPKYSTRGIIPWLTQRNILTRHCKIMMSLGPISCQFIIQSKPVLNTLNIYQSNVNGNDLRYIGSCPKLKCLSLFFSKSLTSRGLEHFLRINPQLERVSISSNDQLSNALLKVIIEVCSHLHHLNISRCSWVTDASLDLIERSNLKLRSLDIHMCHVSTEKVEELMERCHSLRYLQVGRADKGLQILILRKIAFSALEDPDPEVQLLGLQALQEASERIELISYEPDILRRIIRFLSPLYDHRFHSFVLSLCLEYSQETEEDFMTTQLLPSLVPLLSSTGPDEATDIQGEALDLIYELAQTYDDACQFVISNCLTQLMLHPDAKEYIEDLILVLSKGTTTQLTVAFSSLLANEQSRWKVFPLFSEIVSDVNITDEGLQAIKNANLLKFVLEDLLNRDALSLIAGPALSFEKDCFEIILSWCNRYYFDSNILDTFIPFLPLLKSHWKILLPRIREMSISSLHHADLVPMLLSLEMCPEVLSCVIRITERSLSPGNLEVLQFFVDCGILTFLASSLKSKANQSSSPEGVINLLQRIMLADKRYVEMVVSLNLPRSINRVVMKGFI